MGAGRSHRPIALAATLLAPLLVLGGCGHVVALDESQFGPSTYVVECNEDAQCLQRMARVCPGGYQAFRPGAVEVGAVLAADVPTEAFVREPARAMGLDVRTPRRRYIRCVDDASSSPP
jgi:hypothetical protein